MIHIAKILKRFKIPYFFNVICESCFSYLPSHNLVMHVIEKFSSAILIYKISRTTCWINYMPMPVMQINANVFPKIG